MTTDKNRLSDVLSSFSTGMLVTLGGNPRPSARPMFIADRDEDGVVWFATKTGSGKLDELREDPRASITFQGGGRYAHLRGNAVPYDDDEKVSELWSDAWKPWFPEGPEDSDIHLIKFNPEEGEFWDASGVEALSFAFDAAKALINDEKIDTSERRHGSVQF